MKHARARNVIERVWSLERALGNF
ncbi:hypothetical protein RDI58_022490 [Solanum bulbocastanum]|uniref:Uncharacterized protein n=1 Tax=Solanum bulbocastanum TaxID=147425 RepID=A0AAN8TAT0_SOLBU